MEKIIPRRGFLGHLGAILGGLIAVPALTTSAQARSRRRFYGGWGGYRGYPIYRRNSHRRFGYGYGYGGYRYGGYGGYAPGYYAPGAGYYAPAPRVIVPAPRYYGPPVGGYYPPMIRLDTPARDALALLEL